VASQDPADPAESADRTDPAAADDPPERLQLSIAQVAASSLAAVSAAVVCSLFGVAGTFVGAAIASVCATVGSALYAHSWRRTQSRLRRLHRAGAASPPLAEVVKTTRQQGTRLLSQIRWPIVALGTASVFVFSMEVVTVIELGVGKPVAAVLGVSHSGSRETTINSLFGGGSKRSHTPHPTPSPTPTDTPSSTPSTAPSTPSSPSGSPSRSATPTSTPTAPTSPPVTPSPSGSTSSAAAASSPTG
jgi:hypothetical protein